MNARDWPLPPPHPSQMPLLTRLIAGMGVSTVLADVDFESFSAAGYVWNAQKKKWDGPPRASQNKKGLFVIGAKPYAEHPSTEVLCMAYDLKDGWGKRHWRPGLPLPFDLFMYLAKGGLIEAHNSMFERLIWEHVCMRLYGFPAVPDSAWRCSMAKCRASSYPGALGDVSNVMQLQVRKDTDGKRLLDKFSVPQNPTAANGMRFRIYPTLDPASPDYADTIKLYGYNGTDIEAEAEASSRVPDLEGEELAWWQEDQQINLRGVKIDQTALANCTIIIDQCHEQYNAELNWLTGGAVPRASMLARLKDWLVAHGMALPQKMDEETLDALLADTDPATVPPICRRPLEIRQLVGSAAVKKVFSIRNRLDLRGRLTDLFIYYGAHTGRVTGDGPQPTNMPSGGPRVYKCVDARCGRWHGTHTMQCPWCGTVRWPDPPNTKTDDRGKEWNVDAVEDALLVIAGQDMKTVERFFGDAMHAVSGCIRGLFIAEDDSDLVSSDYNSIEAVGLAFIAGEQWRMDVFRTHGKIYETSAARMFSKSFDEVMAVSGYTAGELGSPKWWEQNEGKPATPTGSHHPLRKKGKIGELAFGFGGWLGAAKQFKMPGDDEQIKADILAWRAASPSVCWFWGGQTVGAADSIRHTAGMTLRLPLVWDRRTETMEPDRWNRDTEYFGCEGAFVQAVMYPGREFIVYRLDGTDSGVSYQMRGPAVYCKLPSGRYLTYHNVRLGQQDRPGMQILFERWNTNSKMGARGWISVSTFGGRLVENVVQATCRDILRPAVLRLRAAGYRTVLHVYDEIVCEVVKGWGSVKELEALMMIRPWWCSHWPIKAAGGWRGRRYRKG